MHKPVGMPLPVCVCTLPCLPTQPSLCRPRGTARVRDFPPGGWGRAPTSLLCSSPPAAPAQPRAVHAGDQAADEEGVHPGVLPRPQVHVGVLHAHQPWPQLCRQQDVRQGRVGVPVLTPAGFSAHPSRFRCFLGVVSCLAVCLTSR